MLRLTGQPHVAENPYGLRIAAGRGNCSTLLGVPFAFLGLSAVRQAGDHRVNDQQQQEHTETEEEIAECPGNVLPAEPLVAHAMLVESALGDQAVVPAPALVLQLILRDAAREDNRVHGELLNAEVRVEEVNREDEAGGQQGFIRVNDQGDVDNPTGHEAGEERGEPHDQAGSADDGDAPEDGEVIKLLPVDRKSVVYGK